MIENLGAIKEKFLASKVTNMREFHQGLFYQKKGLPAFQNRAGRPFPGKFPPFPKSFIFLFTYRVLHGPFGAIAISMVTGILKIDAGPVGLVHLIVNQPSIQVSFGIVRLTLQALI